MTHEPLSIIVLEDQSDWAQLIDDALSSHPWQARFTTSGTQFLALLRDDAFDIAILDVNLGDGEPRGVDILAEMRRSGCHIPVLMLTQFATHAKAARALDQGADDYLAKPFDADELTARIRAMRRRAAPLPGNSLTCGALTINLDYRSAHWYDARVELRGQGFDILAELARAGGEPVSHEALWRAVWTKWDRLPPQEQPIQAGISRLRKDLALATTAELVRTVPGVGYCLASI